MAILQIGGATNQSTSNVTTLSVTYSPTIGNTAVLFFENAVGLAGLVVKDNLSNVLSAGPTEINLACFYQLVVPSGVTGYTATWTTTAQCSLVVEEYSGAAAINLSFATNVASATSGTASLTFAITAANNWIVCGLGSANTLTATVGNSRQSTTTSTARINLLDNTSASIGNVTCTATLTSATWYAVGIELGGAGTSLANQDLDLVISQVTNSSAVVNQDLDLVISQVTNSSAVVNQDLGLVIIQPTNTSIVVGQDITLVIISFKPHTGSAEQVFCVT